MQLLQNATANRNITWFKIRFTFYFIMTCIFSYHYCVSCTSKRYYWEKALLLIVKNVGARDCSVRLYMSSNIFLDTGVFYLFKLVGGGVFENICGEWRRIDFNRIETFKISTTYHLKDTRSTSSHPKMNWKLFKCQHHLIYIYAL